MSNRALVDFDSKSVTFLGSKTEGATVVAQDGTATKVTATGEVINPATGKPATGVSGFVSELAGLIAGLYSTDPVKDTTTTGDKETRQQYALMNGMHIDLPAPTKRTVYELFRPSDGSRAEVAFHVKAAGKVRVELAGATSGAVVGGASLGGAAGTIMEGALDSYRKESSGGDFDVNLRLDGGDAKVLLVLTPA